ncbi:hypothetical protein SEA_JACKO_2 [Microbacterium phage Jacko]|nr:hypothetical protein SEA_JACKO_111 [Microbacterium phage Jacko]AXC37969.1 hypothetical protein SEA_JACKO_2 [Microbacterium phage Jacko]
MTFRRRTRDAAVHVACAVVGLILGYYSVFLIQDALTPPTTLPPCPTEDSSHCYWDASNNGNGLGSDVVSP